MPKKLHLGNGTVYLDGWINIDSFGLLAKDHPDLVKHNITTVKNYYKYPFRQNKNNFVTDMLMDVRKLDFEDNSIDEVLCVNLIDHLKKEEFIQALQEWKRVLAKGGRLIIDVDDRKQQAQMLIDARTTEEIEQALRCIYCNHANGGDTHWWGYTPEYLKHILKEAGYKYLWTRHDYIVHDTYPNFQICVQK